MGQLGNKNRDIDNWVGLELLLNLLNPAKFGKISFAFRILFALI